MEQKTAPFFVEREGYHIHLNEVAAWVCNLCIITVLLLQQHSLPSLQPCAA
jgi:hypothetical protein